MPYRAGGKKGKRRMEGGGGQWVDTFGSQSHKEGSEMNQFYVSKFKARDCTLIANKITWELLRRRRRRRKE